MVSRLGEERCLAYLGSCQGAGQPRLGEESPGSTKQGWRVTPAVGNHRESATESIPPMARKEQQCKSITVRLVEKEDMITIGELEF